MSDATQAGAVVPSEQVSFNEMDERVAQALEAGKKPDFAAIKLEGDNIPEGLRGKSVAEVVEAATRAQEALKISESARQSALAAMEQASRTPHVVAAPAPAPEPEPEITEQMVAEAFTEDQSKGIALMTKMSKQMIEKTARQYEARINPMLQGSAASAEQYARTKHAEAFGLYEKEIKDTLNMVQDKSLLGNPKAWDDLIAYVVGTDPDRLVNARIAKQTEAARVAAQQTQQQQTGFQPVVVAAAPNGAQPPVKARGGVSGREVVIDDYVREICRIQGQSIEDYIKWS